MAQDFSRPRAVFAAIQLALAQGMPAALIPANFSYQSRGHGTGARHKQAIKHPYRNAGNKYAHTSNGEREMARRQRQMRANMFNACRQVARMMDEFDRAVAAFDRGLA